jgi:hypothetical protein
MKTKRAAIYVRVSTAEQDTGLQETELREYVESRGWCCVVYRDQGQSGAKNDRPALTIAERLTQAESRCGGGVGTGSASTFTEAFAHHCGRVQIAGSGLGIVAAEHRYNSTSGQTDVCGARGGGGVRARDAARAGESRNGTGTPCGKACRSPSTTSIRAIRRRNNAAAAFSRHQCSQAGDGLQDHAVDGGKAHE